jgi:hypothetical protein
LSIKCRTFQAPLGTSVSGRIKNPNRNLALRHLAIALKMANVDTDMIAEARLREALHALGGRRC